MTDTFNNDVVLSDKTSPPQASATDCTLQVKCTNCNKTYSGRFSPFCEECGAFTDADYDIDRVHIRQSGNPYERFFDLLPVNDLSHLPSNSTFTPTVHARRLGAELGLPNLYLKNETELPTRTTKDRMAAVALAYLYECGVRVFCTSSTGNSSTAYAQAIERFPELKIYLFTASDFRRRVQYRPASNIVHYVLRGASFVEAFNYAGRFASRNGFVSERGFFNLGRREGLKLAFLEAAEQVPQPIDWYVQATSSAMGVFGTCKGAGELLRLDRIRKIPRPLCVQQETCAPMVRAFEDGAEVIKPEHIVDAPSGIAEAILRGDPTRTYPVMRKIVTENDGTFTAVSELQIREARQLVEDTENISPCFSASTAVAGLIKLVREDKFPRNDTVLINLTGGDRPTQPWQANDSDARWLVKSGEEWAPEDPARDEGLVHGP